jgi:uroporphyrinogen-III decarboxylase
MMNSKENFIRVVKGEKAAYTPILLKECAKYLTHEDVEKERDANRKEIASRIYDSSVGFLGWPYNGVLPYVTCAHNKVTHHKTDGQYMTVIHAEDGQQFKAVNTFNPQTGTWWAEKHYAETPDEIAKIISIPWNADDIIAAPLPVLPDTFNERVLVRTRISSPVTSVASLTTYENFLELCALDLPFVMEMTEVLCARVLKCLELAFDRYNPEIVLISGCEELTPPMASPALYEALIQPQETKIIDLIHRHGAFCHVHCHGNMRSSLEQVIRRGADVIDPMEPPPDGDITMEEAKKAVAGRMAIAGNIEQRILETGTPAAVKAAVEEAFKGGKERFMLMNSGMFLGQMSDSVKLNYHAMIDVWEKLRN